VAVVLDSDAIVGFLDRDDALHEEADAAIRDLVRGQRLLVSVVTYAEVLTGAKLCRHGEDHVRGFFSRLISGVLPVDTTVADMAAGLRARSRSLRMPDALIVATAEIEPDVGVIVTGDRQVARLSGLKCEVRLLG
jgi:predicted nucleic acid-binding protein